MPARLQPNPEVIKLYLEECLPADEIARALGS